MKNMKNEDKHTIKIRKAYRDEYKKVSEFLDNTLVKEGYGFVTSAQVETECKKRRIFIALDGDNIVGVRTGTDCIYNLAVDSSYRGQGIGMMLIDVCKPYKVRVKAEPIGHLSKKQKEGFKCPRGFYDKAGYRFSHKEKGKNFWSGEKDGKRIFIKEGEKEHIEVFVTKEQRRLHEIK